MNQLQYTMSIIQVLGALIGTEGVSDEVKKLSNEQIEKLITSVVKPSLQEFTARMSGLITQS
jgi:hypothetical protein